MRNELRSYKELPLNLYQIQAKFRDEIRPRFGLLRSREFVMKDAYSFHDTQESLQEDTTTGMCAAYERICDRVAALSYRPVRGRCRPDRRQRSPDEFHGACRGGRGRARVLRLRLRRQATEAGEGLARPTVYDVPEMEKVATPGVHTIAELAEFLGIPESSTVKALSGKNDEGKLVVLFVPGDHEVNEVKAARAAGGFTHAHRRGYGILRPAQGLHGPGRPARGRLRHRGTQLEGACRSGSSAQTRTAITTWARSWARTSRWTSGPTCASPCKPGDCCPKCGMPLKGARGIEVAQVFQLGDKYSRAMGATFMDEDGEEQPFIMGCYGVGVSRTLAAIVEQHNDENGIMWPLSVAPAHVCVMPLTVGDDEVQPAAEKLAERARRASAWKWSSTTARSARA